MKLRLDSQSIRIRVRKSDIETLAAIGFIEETVHFSQGRLVYKLELSAQSQEVGVTIKDESILVLIPKNQATSWINSETVGIYTTLSTGYEKKILKILIEKDFPCKHGSTADNADTFDELSKS